jgi:hypothetical protein
LTQDRGRRALDQSVAEACGSSTTSANKASLGDIERRLSMGALTNLGAPEGFLEKCLEEGAVVSKFQPSFASMPGAVVGPSMTSTVEHLGDSEKKALVAEYYLNMNRLKLGSQAALESLAAIDSVLGKNPLADQSCTGSRIAAVDATCRRLQACTPSHALASEADELAQLAPLVQKLEAKVSQGEARKNGAGGRTAVLASAREFEEAAKQLQLLKAMYPALEGKKFKEVFDSQKNNAEEALKKQLEETRQALLTQLSSYQKGVECLNGFSCSAECKEYPEALAKAPSFRMEAFKSQGQGTREDTDVQSYLSGAECRVNRRVPDKEAWDQVNEVVIGAALTVATSGISSVAAAAKAATLAARAGRAATAVKTTTTVAQAGDAARAGSTGFKALDLTSKAGFARAAMLGGDIYFAASDVNSAIDQCSELLNQLSSVPTPKTKPENKPETTSGGGCPGAIDSRQVQVMADYRACVLSVALSVGTNALPVVPDFVARYRVRKAGPQLAVDSKATASAASASIDLLSHELPANVETRAAAEFEQVLKQNQEAGFPRGGKSYEPKPTYEGEAGLTFFNQLGGERPLSEVESQINSATQAFKEGKLKEVNQAFDEVRVTETEIALIEKDLKDSVLTPDQMVASRKRKEELEKSRTDLLKTAQTKFDAATIESRELAKLEVERLILQLKQSNAIDPKSIQVFSGREMNRLQASTGGLGEFFPDLPVLQFKLEDPLPQDAVLPNFVRGIGEGQNRGGQYFTPDRSGLKFLDSRTRGQLNSTPDSNDYQLNLQVEMNPGAELVVGSIGDLRPDFTQGLDVISPGKFSYDRKGRPLVGGGAQIKRLSTGKSEIRPDNILAGSAGVEGPALKFQSQVVAAKKAGGLDSQNYDKMETSMRLKVDLQETQLRQTEKALQEVKSYREKATLKLRVERLESDLSLNRENLEGVRLQRLLNADPEAYLRSKEVRELREKIQNSGSGVGTTTADARTLSGLKFELGIYEQMAELRKREREKNLKLSARERRSKAISVLPGADFDQLSQEQRDFLKSLGLSASDGNGFESPKLQLEDRK